MAVVTRISEWRARRAAAGDVPIGAPPFVLIEPCAGCGSERVGALVWRQTVAGADPVPYPRIEPHYLCREGRVVFQDITDAPIPQSAWTGILGRFRA
ncbi:MAG: hypothetical protein ABJC07_12730 [Acidobacteriota bacterium]